MIEGDEFRKQKSEIRRERAVEGASSNRKYAGNARKIKKVLRNFTFNKIL